MKYKIISIKDSTTREEKNDSKSIERKSHDYKGLVFLRGQALMFLSSIEYISTSNVMSVTGLEEKQDAIILTTMNSIYILKVEEY